MNLWGARKEEVVEDDTSAAPQDAHEDDETTNNGENADDESKQTTATGNQPTTANVMNETYKDVDNEYHEVIRNQNWDLLEILLKEYDFKMYAKAKEKPKKPARKLRVAKYLPDMSSWKKETELPRSPLYSLDALGRAPLHLCCVNPCPDKALSRLLFCARDVAAVPDETGSLPIHLAVTHERSIEVVDKIIRAYYKGSWEPDGSGRTPLMWAIEIVRRHKFEIEKDTSSPNQCFWGYASTAAERQWQANQVPLWTLVEFMLKNRISRRKNLLPREYKQMIQCLGLGATPQVLSLLLKMGKEPLQIENIAGQVLTLCINRQYPLKQLEQMVETCTEDYAKVHKDTTGRGVVSAHYRIGCVTHQEDGDTKRESFRMTMQHLANAVGQLQERHEPSEAYLVWWEKLKYLINLWGSHVFEDDASHDDFDYDDLILHNALSNPDVPPSLVRLLAAMRPHCTDLEHPKSKALPLHIACRVWRFRQYPPRRGEKEIKLDMVVRQLMEGDSTRTRKRYKDRLPLHHAVAAGKNWEFLKPLVVHDRKTLNVRDPSTKLYPFQLAATVVITADFESLTRQQFVPVEWKKMKDYDKLHHQQEVEAHYELEQLNVIFELLRQSPRAIDHESVRQEEVEKRAVGPKRKLVKQGLEPTEEVALITQMKMIRGLFGVGNVAAHFLAWAYESTRRGWKTHRSNFGVLKEAIMNGFVPTAMDRWWRKLKYWIWNDCPWVSPEIPRRDDFLLHAALCNPDTSPWIIELLLEVFPRSASIPLPHSEGCYPIHIACVTERYVGLSFEFANKRTVVEMTAKAFSDAALLKWKGRLPIHLALHHSKEWDEIRYLAEDEPVSLAIPDPSLGFFPFQLMALNRQYNAKMREVFEMKAKREVGKSEWKKLSSEERVVNVSRVLEKHELNTLCGVWELLRLNPVLVTLQVGDPTDSQLMGSYTDTDTVEIEKSANKSGSNWAGGKAANLSVASMDFLDDLYEKDIATAREVPKSRGYSQPTGEVLSTSDSSMRKEPRRNKSIQEGGFDGEEYSTVPEKLPPSFVPIETGTDNSHVPEYPPRMDLELGQWDHAELCYPRRKNILLVRHSTAHVIWRTEVLAPGALKESARRTYWIKVLQKMGEQVDIGDLHSVRNEHEQVTLSSVLVEDVPVCIDEDENYIWILVGEDAASAVENYDVQAAMIMTSSLLDIDTGVWLDCFTPEGCHERFSGKGTSHEILEWALTTVEGGISEERKKRFMISRSVLRAAFARGTMNTTQAIADIIIEKSTRRLWFDVAREKLELIYHSRQVSIVKFLVARRAKFERNQRKFGVAAKEVKFLKRLKKKQRHATRDDQSRDQGPTHTTITNTMLNEKDHERNISNGTHLAHMNQPRADTSDDKSLDDVELFDQPAPAPPSKPLLAAAMKAKEQRDDNNRKQSSQKAQEILSSMNQPKVSQDDDISLNPANDLFEEPKGPPPAKPLLEAARKAKAERDRAASKGVVPRMSSLNQPTTIYEDEVSLVGREDIFEPPNGKLPEKPFLAAAKRAKADMELAQKEGSEQASKVLETMNQPKEITSDDDASLSSTRELFEEQKGPPPAKQLLAAAQKAKAERDRVNALLSGLNQPKTEYSDDDMSLVEENELFDPPQGPPPEKALLAAAQKAKAAQEKEFAESSRRAAAKLRNMNQPKTIQEDEVSLFGQDELFDAPTGPPPEKQLLAAAKKAKAVRDKVSALLNGMNQPKTEYSDDDISLVEVDELFDPPKGPPPEKALLAAAQKAKAAQEKEFAESSRRATDVLLSMNQPKTIHEDEVSLFGQDELFDAPKGPPPEKQLLAAAKKAKAERDRVESVLNGLNQPKTEYSDDDMSLVEVNELFDPPKGPPPEKALLAAAQKAKAAQEKEFAESSRRATDVLLSMNQPKTIHEDEVSLFGQDELFDAPKGPPPEKQLLAAAKKAKAERDRVESVLNGLNQPKTEYSDDDMSLVEVNELFDPPKGPPPEKALLAAAQKAKAAREKEFAESSRRATDVLLSMNQPKTIQEDEVSLFGQDELFDAPKGPPPEKQLLAAARKAKAERDRVESVLNGLNQPKTKYEDDDASLVEVNELFEKPRGPPPQKPLLEAAHKAKAARESAYAKGSSRATAKLQTMNQPKTIYEDEVSLAGNGDLFDEPKGPKPDKPFLAAALKAKQERENSSMVEAALRAQHQADGGMKMEKTMMTRPKGLYADDDSLDSSQSVGSNDDTKDPTKTIGSPKAGMGAASLRAKQQVVEERANSPSRRGSLTPGHLLGMNQPFDDISVEGSLGDDELFDAPRPPPERKPLLAAALKAKKEREQAKRVPPHLSNVHQPRSTDNDDCSIATTDVFDPPKGPPPRKPLLAAALKAKADRDRGICLSPQPAGGILKSSTYEPSGETKIHDGSISMLDVFVKSPTRVKGQPNRIVVEKAPKPMKAERVLQDSVSRLRVSDHSPSRTPSRSERKKRNIKLGSPK